MKRGGGLGNHTQIASAATIEMGLKIVRGFGLGLGRTVGEHVAANAFFHVI